MAGRHAERSKSHCDSVSQVSKGKLAHQIYLRARHFASRGLKTAELGQDGSQPNECNTGDLPPGRFPPYIPRMLSRNSRGRPLNAPPAFIPPCQPIVAK